MSVGYKLLACLTCPLAPAYLDKMEEGKSVVEVLTAQNLSSKIPWVKKIRHLTKISDY